MASDLHVIFGTGPVGCWTARALRDLGLPVRAVNRSGHRPELLPVDVEVVAADVSDPAQAISAAEGASVIYQALNPEYHQWHEFFPGLQAGALAAAKATGARYISIDNLYMYDSFAGAITEESSIAPHSRKGELRQRMAEEVLSAHRAGEVCAAILRSSDYYGPGVLGSALGDRVFPPILAGKRGEAICGLDFPHSYAYIEDVGRAAAALGTNEAALGQVWISPHATPPTQREVLDGVFAITGTTPSYSVVKPWMMKLVGMFSPGAKEMVEMLYEFDRPFTVDSGKIERALGLRATPLAEGLARTVEWYRAQPEGGAL